MKRLLPIFLSFLTALALLVIVVLTVRPVQAQNGIVVDKRLGRASNLVHVGEYLTFTIYIENRTNFTVTTLPLSDTFNSGVLAYADAAPPPSSTDLPNGRLDWADLTTHFGDLPPGQGITVVVGFIAEHPAPAVVNRAEVHDALSSGGGLPGSGGTSDDGEAVGGAAPLSKEVLGGQIPQVGFPLTFTIRITNDGFTTMTVIPLLEDYEPDYLKFLSADPQPDTIDEVAGELRWSDLTLWFGDVAPHEVITVLVVFEPLAAVDVTVNRASSVGAKDWYDNDLEAGADQVPIVIIGAGTQTTPTPSATAEATATATSGGGGGGGSEVTATPTAVATPASLLPTRLPDTGVSPTAVLWPLLAFFAPLAGWVVWRFRSKK